MTTSAPLPVLLTADEQDTLRGLLARLLTNLNDLTP